MFVAHGQHWLLDKYIFETDRELVSRRRRKCIFVGIIRGIIDGGRIVEEFLGTNVLESMLEKAAFFEDGVERLDVWFYSVSKRWIGGVIARRSSEELVPAMGMEVVVPCSICVWYPGGRHGGGGGREGTGTRQAPAPL